MRYLMVTKGCSTTDLRSLIVAAVARSFILVRASSSRFLEGKDPPAVWPYPDGNVRGIALVPLYAGAPKASLRDSKLYSSLALADAIRSGRAREKNLAVELLREALNA